MATTPPEAPAPSRLDAGARIDAIQAALHGLASSDADAPATLRTLARATVDGAQGPPFAALRAAAERLEFADVGQLAPCARELITRLREVASAQRPEPAVLVVGGDPTVFSELAAALAATGRPVLAAPNGAEARRLLRERQVLCVLLHVVLPDLDGRTLLTRLRETPASASIPVLLLGERLDDALKEETRLHAADGFLEAPRDTAAMAQWVTDRLRRTTESVKSARRDLLTGLPNRAAFREDFVRLQQECSDAGEPLALAAITVDSTRTALGALDPDARKDVLQAFGLVLTSSLRTTDIVARTGMYEFAALFPGQDLAGGRRAIEKVIEKLRTRPPQTRGGQAVAPALSAGVTVVAPGAAMDDAIAEVEQFVYQSATLGGNLVVSDKQPQGVVRQRKVLLLVKDVITTRVLQQLLEKDNFAVTRLEQWSPATATDVARQRHHLVVIDAQFPPGGGHEVVRDLRADPRNARLPIIMLVAGNAEQSIAQALEFGANDYLVRPFSPMAFVNRTHRLLSRLATEGPGACRLLLIADDVPTLVLLGTALHQCGQFEILLARGAKDGLERIQAESPDAVVVDAALRAAGPIPLWDALAAAHAQSPFAVIVADAPPAKDAKPRAYPLPIRGHINKPFSPLKVSAEIEAALELSQQRRPPSKDAQQKLSAEIHRATRKESTT